MFLINKSKSNFAFNIHFAGSNKIRMKLSICRNFFFLKMLVRKKSAEKLMQAKNQHFPQGMFALALASRFSK